MKIAVIGSGGREHALVKKLRESPLCGEIIAIPGNGGMAAEAQCMPLAATDVDGIVACCTAQGVEYVVVGPDDPLALGLVDALEQAGIPAFGPGAAAAQIEASKVFAKGLMQKYNIPTAGFLCFDAAAEAIAHLRRRTEYPVVVKADGLALGKGVLICKTFAEAEAAVRGMMEERMFGDSGSRVVVEDFLTGPEVSVLALCDGETLLELSSSMDHKRAFDGDEGPNTGGMGCIAPNPFYSGDTAKRCMEEIFLPTLAAMRAEGRPFCGCLYFGLMLTEAGPKVIEYNCRFGDPETQTVLPLLDGDLLELMLACTNGTLAKHQIPPPQGAAACVVLASGGYPGKYKTGLPICGLAKAAALPGAAVAHAGTRLGTNGTDIETAGGRVLGITAVAPTLRGAVENAYAAAGHIHFENMHLRRDIGAKALAFLEKSEG